MKILLSKKSKANDEYYSQLKPAQMVKRVAEYLKNNLVDGKIISNEPNVVTLRFNILHMLPENLRKQMKEFQEITSEIDPDILYMDTMIVIIKTFSDCLQAAVIFDGSTDGHVPTGPEKTLCYVKFYPKDLISLPACKDKLLNTIERKVKKEFAKYDVSDIRESNYKTRRSQK